MIRIGVIGYGGRIQGVINLMEQLNAGTKIVAINDPRADEIKKMLQDNGKDPSEIEFYDTADEMLDKANLDAAMVGTRCSLHAQNAIKVIQRNLPMFLEKPIATSMDDLVALRDAAKNYKSQAVVSFPLRMTPLVVFAKEIIDSGQLGTIEHVQAWNNVPYGWVYFQGWYRDENETNGLFLQKATHDFDYINYLIPTNKPKTICAMMSKQIYKGDRPAGLKCKDCKEWQECLESPYHAFITKGEATKVEDNDLWCGFAEDVGNEDSSSALVMYESGMHLAYSQNFFARKKAGARGARLLGYKGTIEFDWYTDEVKVFMHHSPRVETYKMETGALSHGGGDTVLVDSFVKIIQGKGNSVAPISAGLQSVLMCLKAKESALTNTFQDIKYPDE